MSKTQSTTSPPRDGEPVEAEEEEGEEEVKHTLVNNLTVKEIRKHINIWHCI